MTSLVSILPLVGLATAQFVSPPTDLKTAQGYAGVQVRYKEVPAGTCELDPNVKSYSGYADVAENQHIFWWFFEARNEDPQKAPLTVWINGGPGSSSMIGLFQENGPCFIDENYNVVNNPYSWSNATNMLYIDQPTQTGFSYSIPVPGFVDPATSDIITLPSNDCPDYAADWNCGTYSYPNVSLTASSTPDAAPNFWKTLQGFMGAFPQYSRNEFFFTTESYGGHYGPTFNEYIEQQNAANIHGAHKISLAGVLIGNGWYDPLIQYQAYYNYTVNPGSPYDFQFFNQSIEDLMYNNLYGPGNCVDQIKDCYARGIDEVCQAADTFCANQVENIYDVYAGRDEYDSRELTPDPFPPEFYTQYLNTPAVQQAIGAYVNFTESSTSVGFTFGTTGDDARKLSILQDMKDLLDQGIAVIMYFGDADYNCNFLGGQVVSHEVGAPGFEAAGFVDVTTSDCVVHGQVRQSGNFAFVRIYQSGHEVPFYQPVIALEMLERVIAGKDIATGTKKADSRYRTQGPQQSTYREGNATVQLDVVPTDDTYNTTTNEPNPYNATSPSMMVKRAVMAERAGLGRRGPSASRRRRSIVRREPVVDWLKWRDEL